MTLSAIAELARAEHLAVFGAFHTNEADGVGAGTMILLGPDEPGFWAHVTAQPEFLTHKTDPLDQWSDRVISTLAQKTGGTAFFPFGDPVRPFISWALRSGKAWVSPAHLLVHETAGLFVSYRGAICLPERLELPPAAQSPCETCSAKPCLTACPTSALTSQRYDLPACHAFLDTPQGQSCMSQGCAVRRACPLSENYARVEAQSAFHMAQFHK